jgi:hypothetical protein
MFNTKNTKYQQLSATAGFGFLPIIFETSGYVHPEVLSLLKSVANQASALSSIPEATLYNYYLKCLSMELQKGLAESITGKLAMVARGRHHDHALNYDVMIEELSIIT